MGHTLRTQLPVLLEEIKVIHYEQIEYERNALKNIDTDSCHVEFKKLKHIPLIC